MREFKSESEREVHYIAYVSTRRGGYIEAVVNLEVLLHHCIACSFVGDDEQKETEFIAAVLSPQQVTFDLKCTILKNILVERNITVPVDGKSLYNQLKAIGETRNKLAHCAAITKEEVHEARKVDEFYFAVSDFTKGGKKVEFTGDEFDNRVKNLRAVFELLKAVRIEILKISKI